MSQSSILGGMPAPSRPEGKDVDSLGPGDTSDSGSDVQGERTMPTDPDNPGEWGALPVDGSSDSDASGTGERGAATGRPVRDGADILPDSRACDALADESSDRTPTDDTSNDDDDRSA